MAIDHEEHKIRIKAVSDRMNHPMEYNDAGAPKMDPNYRPGGYMTREQVGRFDREQEAHRARSEKDRLELVRDRKKAKR